ncbi:unnamed protein product [Somion occarium]|uniref:Uncharacterized protein n=1 Tax=Somion occarium TaxID=3059160 RepID=A0ABP1E889_9APHY
MTIKPTSKSEAVTGTKRKLSTASASASTVEQEAKKTKVATEEDLSGPDPETTSGKREDETKSEDLPRDGHSDKVDDEHKDDNKKPEAAHGAEEEDWSSFAQLNKRLEGHGPFKFLVSGESLAELEGGAGVIVSFLLTEDVHHIYARLEPLAPEERVEACDICSIPVCVEEDDDLETEEAEKLKEAWGEIDSDGGWVEVTLQKKKPEEGEPALKVSFDHEDVEARKWWMSAVAAPNEETAKAIELVGEHISYGLDGF